MYERVNIQIVYTACDYHMLHIYLGMYVCYAYMYLCTYVYMYVCMYDTHTSMYVRMKVYVYEYAIVEVEIYEVDMHEKPHSRTLRA